PADAGGFWRGFFRGGGGPRRGGGARPGVRPGPRGPGPAPRGGRTGWVFPRRRRPRPGGPRGGAGRAAVPARGGALGRRPCAGAHLAAIAVLPAHRELAGEAALGVVRAADEGAELAELQRQPAVAARRALARVAALGTGGEDVRAEQFVERLQHLGDAKVVGL